MPARARYKLVALALAVVGLWIAVALRTRGPDVSDVSLDRLASGDEVSATFSFDAQSGIVAGSYESGRGGLFTIDVRHDNRVSNAASAVAWPAEVVLSPGGRYIAYHERASFTATDDETLYLTDREKGAARAVVHAGPHEIVGRAAFAPDGRRLLYELVHHHAGAVAPEREWQDELRIVDVETNVDQSLFFDPHRSARGPAWSRDGEHLYFFSDGALVRVVVATGRLEELAQLPADASVFPRGPTEPPVVSDDESTVAFTVLTRDCPHVALFHRDEPAYQLLDESECSLRPTFVGGSGVAYIGYPRDGNRVPRLRSTSTDAPHSFGFDEAMTYGLARDGASLIALMATPTTSRRFVRLPLDRGEPTVLFEPDGAEFRGVVARFASTSVTAPDGLAIPVELFTPSCRTTAGPAVVWVHGSPKGLEDTSPRLQREMAFLLRLGVAIVAVNYRGSTGHGEAFRERGGDEAQARDVIAGLSLLATMQEVDPKRVFLLGVCGAAQTFIPEVVRLAPTAFRGVISLAGPNMPWVSGASADVGPDVLWVRADRDPGVSKETPALARTPALTLVPIDDNHLMKYAASRARELDAMRAFIEERSAGALCGT